MWVKGKRITRIESVVEVPDNFISGVERAIKSQAKGTGQPLAEVRAAAAAATSLGSSRQTWRFRRADSTDRVVVPADAVFANITQLIAALNASTGAPS